MSRRPGSKDPARAGRAPQPPVPAGERGIEVVARTPVAGRACSKGEHEGQRAERGVLRACEHIASARPFRFAPRAGTDRAWIPGRFHPVGCCRPGLLPLMHGPAPRPGGHSCLVFQPINATVRIRLWASANSNATQRTLRRPRTRNCRNPRFRAAAFTHSAVEARSL